MLQQGVRQNNRTILGSLALSYPQQVPLTIDVADPELTQFADPQTAAVADLQHQVVLTVGTSGKYPGNLSPG